MNLLVQCPRSIVCFANLIYANRINSRSMSRVFCDLRSQKTPRGILPVNSNIKTLHFHPNQQRRKRPTGFIRSTATTRYSSPTTKKRETAWDKNCIIQTIKKQKTWIKSKLSALFSVCGRWDLNPHEHTPTRSLVLPVCQFQHSRALSLSERQVILYPRKTEKSTLFWKIMQKN